MAKLKLFFYQHLKERQVPVIEVVENKKLTLVLAKIVRLDSLSHID